MSLDHPGEYCCLFYKTKVVEYLPNVCLIEVVLPVVICQNEVGGQHKLTIEEVSTNKNIHRTKSFVLRHFSIDVFPT